MRKIEPLEVDEPSVLKEPNILEKVLSLVFGEGKFEVAQDVSPHQTPEETQWIGAFEVPQRLREQEWFAESGFEIPMDEGVFGGRKWDDKSVAW